ncbi:hypothetical protein [Flavobacterium sp.]|uniref:hypothetical protein n=1 Tax=Flavobacterium sp. TaxID=239 RepID=UPI002CB6A6F1|nr:hypothetical protein [Flavobacterium sp.]HSD09121.1 hypothetical protein [Flavobacterium sp.]
MKKALLLLPAIFILSCGSKTESNSDKISEIKTGKSNNLEKEKEEPKTNFEKYSKEGILLIGSIKLFDENFKEIGELKINEISKVQILEKSSTFFNIENSKDYCLKANFIKIGYKGKKYLVFGREVYEINKTENLDFQNEKKEAFSIFPITNFEMGASDDNGSTGCDDFSYLILLDKKNEKYSTITAPKNQENNSTTKFANLVHDDGSAEEIYNVKVINDSLILGIKVSHQEGYGSYNLKSSFKDNFGNSIESNRNRFYEETKYNELK